MNATNLIHPKYGYFVHLPFVGGIYDQPYITMKILNIVKVCFIELIEERNKNP